MSNQDMPYVFICHSHPINDKKYEEFITELKEGLAKNGIDCFIDHVSFRAGEVWQDKLLLELEKADCIIVVENKELLCSDYCGLERGFAYARQIPEMVLVHEESEKKISAFVSTQKVTGLELSSKWWKEITDFVNKKHAEQKKRTHIEEEVNAIVAVMPNLSGVQLSTILSAVANSIQSKLKAEYSGNVKPTQKESRSDSDINIDASQSVVSKGKKNE